MKTAAYLIIYEISICPRLGRKIATPGKKKLLGVCDSEYEAYQKYQKYDVTDFENDNVTSVSYKTYYDNQLSMF